MPVRRVPPDLAPYSDARSTTRATRQRENDADSEITEAQLTSKKKKKQKNAPGSETKLVTRRPAPLSDTTSMTDAGHSVARSNASALTVTLTRGLGRASLKTDVLRNYAFTFEPSVWQPTALVSVGRIVAVSVLHCEPKL